MREWPERPGGVARRRAAVSAPAAIVLYDGVCGLCTAAVRFIIRRDPQRRFQFSSLHSETGRRLAVEAGVEPGSQDTLVLLEEEGAFQRSDAALRIARRLTWPWRLATVLLYVPKIFRDPLYRLVARYRYRLFGRGKCEWRPELEVHDRFLDLRDSSDASFSG